jgi:ketosteroid isomerase-like protein
MADNATTIRNVYDGFARGDISVLLAALDDRVEWNEAEHFTYWPGGPFIGPQAVLAGVIGRLAEDIDGFAIEPRRIVAMDSTVLVEARYRGTAKATGRVIDAQVAHVWDLRDGRVVRFQQYTDTWQFAQVTGVTPAERLLA